MTASDQIEGNRLIFKSSPLKGLKKAARTEVPEPVPSAPLDVTAAPQPVERTPEVRPAAPRDDVTTFSFEPLPAAAPKPETSPPEASEDAPAPVPEPIVDKGRVLAYVLLAAAAGAVLLALMWLGLI